MIATSKKQRVINWLKFWGVPLLKCALLFIIVYFVAVDALTADWSE